MHAHLLQMLSHSNFLSLHHSADSNTFPLRAFPRFLVFRRDFPPNFGSIGLNASQVSSFHEVSVDSSVCSIHGYGVQSAGIEFDSFDLDRFADVGNQLADAAGDVIRKYFRKSFEILDKVDLSPVTIADQAAEESMVQGNEIYALILFENIYVQISLPFFYNTGQMVLIFRYGEKKGWKCKEEVADYVWILDPIDGTKSFITGKPLFETLIALLHKGHLSYIMIIEQIPRIHLKSTDPRALFTIPVLREMGWLKWKEIYFEWAGNPKSPLATVHSSRRPTCTQLARIYSVEMLKWPLLE